MYNKDSKVYKLFISHVSRDDEEYQLFLSKLNASYDFEWEDHALQGKILTEEIAEQMDPVDIVLILSGLLSKDEELVVRQLEVAMKQKKPILVIRPYGMENVPSNLEEIAVEVVGWNTPCIVDTIKDSLQEME